MLVFLLRRTFDAEVAYDLTAETFARALASRRRFRGSGEEEARAWLFGIARNVLGHYIRRGRAEARAVRRLGLQVPSASADELGRAEELADLAADRESVARAMELLSDREREAVRLRVVDELGYDELAARLGVRETTARARVSRGLRRLASELDPPTAGEAP